MTYKEIINIIIGFGGMALLTMLSIVWHILIRRMDSMRADLLQSRVEVEQVRAQVVDVISAHRVEVNERINGHSAAINELLTANESDVNNRLIDISRELRHSIRDTNNGLMGLLEKMGMLDRDTVTRMQMDTDHVREFTKKR